ncbi:MAG TPA: acyl carrier protein [Shewanella frigidimarina]|nr:acyl carrier protein [Shewanella frigidimarina]
MSKQSQILEIVAEILEIEVDKIELDTVLDEDSWDSLAVVTFIAEIDTNFDQVVSPSDVGSAKKVLDLVNLVK